MQSQGKKCSEQECVETEIERLNRIERKLRLIDKQLDEVYETIAPWQIWIDVTTQMEKEDNVELYYRDAEQFYPENGNVRDGGEAVHEPGNPSIKIADHREERD